MSIQTAGHKTGVFAFNYASGFVQTRMIYVTHFIYLCPNGAHGIRGLFRAIFMPSYRNL